MPFPQEIIHTLDDIYALPDGQRAELIDGHMYMIAPPNTLHQEIGNYIKFKLQRGRWIMGSNSAIWFCCREGGTILYEKICYVCIALAIAKNKLS